VSFMHSVPSNHKFHLLRLQDPCPPTNRPRRIATENLLGRPSCVVVIATWS
jgi:hypothetical protein